ncbi:agouti-signaling protein 2b [Trichomycterus rosablanca]|uniref:agouti-signaling protein 2b n=1 Tax=Trichomycterus rosablanca TaxID=2290929 RepID=UPI002F355049
MFGKYVLCGWFCFALIQAAADLRQKHVSDAGHQGSSEPPGTKNQENSKGLFSRTRYLSQHQLHQPKPKPEPAGVAPGPVRRCARLMENCSAHIPCCEPCSFCHCRLFNTVCQCWRLGRCSKKS